MNNIVKVVQSQIKSSNKPVSFLDVAEPGFAIEIARELGYKVE